MLEMEVDESMVDHHLPLRHHLHGCHKVQLHKASYKHYIFLIYSFQNKVRYLNPCEIEKGFFVSALVALCIDRTARLGETVSPEKLGELT